MEKRLSEKEKKIGSVLDLTMPIKVEENGKKKVSYSQLNVFRDCPYHWKLRYIDKIYLNSASIYTVFGTSMHEIIQLYLKVMYNKSIREADELPLEQMLEYRMAENFKKAQEQAGENELEITQDDMVEFYYDGLEMIDWFKKHRREYFSKKGYELIGIEVPLMYEMESGIYFNAYLDLVFRDTISNKYIIIDIKTASFGWNKYQKKDEQKTSQLVLYKEFYAKQYGVPVDNIDVKFFIIKRKLYENNPYVQKRVQQFTPASGKPTRNKILKVLNEFIETAFIDTEHNTNIEYDKTPSKKSCKWCEFKGTKYCNGKKEK